MGLAILFFLFFFGFLDVFFGFWPKVSKTSRKPKKPKKTKLQTLTRQLVPHGSCNFVFFVFFWFSRGFLVFDQKYQKPRENQKKNKIADPNSPACTYMGLAILFFLFVWFSQVFWFLTKSIKNLEKTNKNKKNKIADPNSPACTYMGLAILALFAFLHDVRPCARWWLQFIKECSNCIKMTVFAHCQGSPFWSFSGIKCVSSLSVFSKDRLPHGFSQWISIGKQPKELRHVNFQPSRPWSQSNVGCNEAHSASVVAPWFRGSRLKMGKETLDFYRDL